MSDTAELDLSRRGRVLVATLRNPPVNAISPGLRRLILAAVEHVRDDPEIAGLVLTGAGRHFSGGADIRNVGTVPERPDMPDLVNAIAACAKPVVAAVNGAAVGAGLEICLACSERVAGPHSRFGLPEVRLGIIPAAGGTQRLPRLIGAAPALALIAGGRIVDVAEASALGLCSLVPTDDVVGAATARVHARSAARQPGRTASRLGDRAAFDAAVAQLGAKRDDPEIAACIEAIAACFDRSVEDGMLLERRLVEALRGTERSRMLRAAFLSRR